MVDTPGTYNLTIYQGSKLTRVFTYLDANDDPVDLTGYTARAQVRKDHRSGTILLDLDSEEEITLGGAAGTITIVVPATETAALNLPHHAFWDLELLPGGVEADAFRLLQGKVTISEEVTQ